MPKPTYAQMKAALEKLAKTAGPYTLNTFSQRTFLEAYVPAAPV